MTGMTYSLTIIALAAIGLAFSLQFLTTHRPRHWRRWQAFDASGWVLIVAIAYTRTLVLTISNWPGQNHALGSAAIGIGLSALVDALVILRVVAYSKFRNGDRAGEHK